ncbi:hypothetical protein D3Z38_04310 [Clostridiales bacterium]|nr:hypothetical protein [Clostridiales bacterium]
MSLCPFAGHIFSHKQDGDPSGRLRLKVLVRRTRWQRAAILVDRAEQDEMKTHLILVGRKEK